MTLLRRSIRRSAENSLNLCSFAAVCRGCRASPEKATAVRHAIFSVTGNNDTLHETPRVQGLLKAPPMNASLSFFVEKYVFSFL